jgi:hypothetical protein
MRPCDRVLEVRRKCLNYKCTNNNDRAARMQAVAADFTSFSDREFQTGHQLDLSSRVIGAIPDFTSAVSPD